MKSKIVLSVFLMLMISVFVSSFASSCKGDFSCRQGYECVGYFKAELTSIKTCKDAGNLCYTPSNCLSGSCSYNCICKDYIDAGQACHDSCSASACIGQVEGTCSTYQCNPYSCDLGPGSSTNGYGSTCYETCGGETCWNDGGCAEGTTCVDGKDGVCESASDAGASAGDVPSTLNQCKSGVCAGSSSGVCASSSCENWLPEVLGTCVPSSYIDGKMGDLIWSLKESYYGLTYGDLETK